MTCPSTTPRAGLRPVLVVDDGEDNRALLAHCLRMAGFTVAEASDGLEALGRMRERPLPCVVLLDLMMPVMDGWAFLEEREEDAALREVPVLVLSAAPDARASLGGREVFGVLEKPFDIGEMMALVQSACAPCAEA